MKLWKSTGGALCRHLRFPNGGVPNLILDDGGDATLLVHKGFQFNNEGKVPSPDSTDNKEEQVILHLLNELQDIDGEFWKPFAESIRGVSEETTTGVHRLYEMQKDGSTTLPSNQRERLRDQEQVRQRLRMSSLTG